MATIKAVLRRWEQIPAQLIPIAAECIEEKQVEIVALNKEQLYEGGTDRMGEPLPPYKSKAYAARKLAMRGKEISDRYLTGAFQDAMGLSVSGTMFGINSGVSYAPYVIARDEKNGNIIMGLTPESKQAAWQIIKPLFIEKLKQKGIGQ